MEYIRWLSHRSVILALGTSKVWVHLRAGMSRLSFFIYLQAHSLHTEDGVLRRLWRRRDIRIKTRRIEDHKKQEERYFIEEKSYYCQMLQETTMIKTENCSLRSQTLSY